MEQSPREAVTQLVKKFPAFYGTQRLNIVLTSAKNPSKSEALCNIS